MALQVEVDQDMCMSSGKCVADHPTAFAFDDEELPYTLPTVTEVSDENLVAAARNCPSGAIVLLDDAGNEVDVL